MAEAGEAYRIEELRAEHLLNRDWRALFAVMAALADRFGEEGVRLVVWFD